MISELAQSSSAHNHVVLEGKPQDGSPTLESTTPRNKPTK